MFVSCVHHVEVINAALCMTQFVNAGQGCKRGPYGRGSKRHSQQAVLQTAVQMCRNLPPEMGAPFTIFGASRTCWMTGGASHKSG